MIDEFLKKIIETTAATTAKQVIEQLGATLHQPTSTASPDDVIFLEQARAMLGNVSAMTLSRWDRSGYLPKRHVGRRVAYRREDINRVLGKRGAE